MVSQRSGIAKVIIVVILLVLVAASWFLMTQEQKARDASMAVNNQLVELIDKAEPVSADEVHTIIGRKPHEARSPGKHRLVEEYHWKGPMSSHTVYAYYSTGATQLLEAVSINQKLDEWEGDDK